jgi:GNAT superfamily N-acetyltransferase
VTYTLQVHRTPSRADDVRGVRALLEQHNQLTPHARNSQYYSVLAAAGGDWDWLTERWQNRPLVGGLMFTQLSGGEVQAGIAVAPEYRGQGVASGLLSQLTRRFSWVDFRVAEDAADVGSLFANSLGATEREHALDWPSGGGRVVRLDFRNDGPYRLHCSCPPCRNLRFDFASDM